MLRPYQQAAHDAAISTIKKCLDPVLIEAATGSGKSHIIAEIAKTLHKVSNGKKILCLAPSAELVVQNREKYLATGNPASVFSASAGGACLRHPVVFGTPGTVKNKIERFGPEFCAIVLDEAHRITPTVITIIESIQSVNPNLRIIGLSATPYRLGSGYIYDFDEKMRKMDETIDPYFKQRVYTVGAHELICQGFLTRPVIGGINAENYDTKNMQLNSMGKFNQADIDQAFHGQGRKTAKIIADIVDQSRDRCGVMIFAATIQHANECLESLPPSLSAIVTGGTSKKERAAILKRFKSRQIKYLVNVSVLTTGFDAPHVDVVAILRATESVALLQQIIGRGLRIDSGKTDCLILDYAENVDRHCPDGDLFDPDITAKKKGDGGALPAKCPMCNYENLFAARHNDDGFAVDEFGYFVDLSGHRIETEFGEMPAHHGRRCNGELLIAGRFTRCAYKWTFKKCPECDAENDISARYCSACKCEIVDPNEKLRIEFKKLKKDPTRLQTDSVVEWSYCETISRAGNEVLKATYRTEHRTFEVWYNAKMKRDLDLFLDAKERGIKTITYKKDTDSRFYKIYAYNQ
jgi:DNA repair protein RadD